MTKPSFEEIAAKKRAERDSHLFKEWLIPEDEIPKGKNVMDFPEKSGYLTKEEIEMTNASAPVIVKKIAEKEWTSYDVTKAFCHRSQIAQQLTNCLSEIFFDEALESAKALDDYYATTGKLKGPLHGLPISLKDNINLKGKDSVIGMVGYCNYPEGGFKFNSAIADLFLDLGAVFYCKTNVPVAMMMAETDNHVFGVTPSPMNRLLSAGGSSGGAGAQAALNGSCIAIGSDIGGSVRHPAAFTGVYGLRPTFGRYPTFGTRSGLPGQESVHSVNGPLCNSMDSLEFYMKTIADADASTYDPQCSYQPWRDYKLPEKLNIAVLWDDGHIKPLPPITRGLQIAVKALKEAGNEVIEWNPAEHAALSGVIFKFLLSDGGKHVMKVIDETGEPLYPFMEEYATTSEMGASTLWDLQAERMENCKKFLQRWNDTAKLTANGKKIDAIIAPVTPHPSCALGKFGDYVGYCSVFNALDYSAGVVPVTTVDKELDAADTDYKTRNASEEYIWKNYDSEESEGGPISIQVACQKSQDEKLVAIMKYIDGLLH